MYLNMHRDIVAKNLGLGLRERARHDTIVFHAQLPRRDFETDIWVCS